MTTELQPIRALIVRRYYFGFGSHVELECGHHKDERERWAGADVLPGERARCFDCELIAAGLMPTKEQLEAFRAQYPAEVATDCA